MNRSSIAVAGAGAIGQVHLQAVLCNPSLKLCAVVDPAAGAAAVAGAAGVPCYASIDELLAQDRPDGIVLATPNHWHLPQALQCLAANLPMLLEKPIAPTLQEATEIVNACEKAKGKILIGHHRAHSPIMAAARQVVQSGQLGRLVCVQGSATFFKPDHYFDEGPWRRELGAGPLLLNMIHEVHNLRMLCGEIAAVQAFKSHAVRGFVVEDTVAITLQFESGVLGAFMLSDTAASAKSWEHTSQENPAYPSYGDEDCYTLSGTLGTLAIPTMRIKSYAKVADCSWWKPFASGQVSTVRDDPIKLQMAHFGAVVRGECAPLVSARDGLQNLRVTEAIVQAAQSGCAVML